MANGYAMADFEQPSKRSGFGQTDDTVPGDGGHYRYRDEIDESRAWYANLKQRAFAGIPALVLVLLFVAKAPLFILIMLVAAAGIYAMHEYLKMVEDGMGPGLPYGPLMTGAGLIGLGTLFSPANGSGMHLMLFVSALLAMYFVWFRGPRETPRELQHAGAALLGLILIPWFINHLGLILQIEGGRGPLNFLIVVITLNDTAAYLVGSLFGKHLLIPEVSPKKTVEGSLGGIGGGVLGGVISYTWLGGSDLGFGMVQLIFLGAVLAAVGQAGDLLESKLKRLNHADDSGHFLPGHGGILDRLDSYLLTAPLFYYYTLWVL